LTEICIPACTDLLVNPDRTPKSQVSLTYFMGQNRPPKNVGVNRHRHSQSQLSLTARGICLLLLLLQSPNVRSSRQGRHLLKHDCAVVFYTELLDVPMCAGCALIHGVPVALVFPVSVAS